MSGVLKLNGIRLILKLFGIAIFGFTGLTAVAYPPQEDGSKNMGKMWMELRQKNSNPEIRISPPKYKRRTPKPVNKVSAPTSTSDNFIGATLWRLRPIVKDDQGVKRLIEDGTQKVEMVPERISSGTNLKVGDRVWLNIEIAREGYLYIIDREKYSGEKGQFSPAYLMLPKKNMSCEQYYVSPGTVIETPIFKLQRSRADHIAEEITIIVSSTQLLDLTSKDLEVDHDQIVLGTKQVTEWQQGIQATEVFELEGGVGQIWTPAEKEAGAGKKRLLDTDPTPQTIYRVVSKSGKPSAISIEMQIK